MSDDPYTRENNVEGELVQKIQANGRTRPMALPGPAPYAFSYSTQLK